MKAILTKAELQVLRIALTAQSTDDRVAALLDGAKVFRGENAKADGRSYVRRLRDRGRYVKTHSLRHPRTGERLFVVHDQGPRPVEEG